MNDAQIIEDVLLGDTSQFAALVDRYLPLVRGLCVSHIQDPDVRNIVQTAVRLRAELHNWYTKDPESGGVQGAGINRAYNEFGSGEPCRDVIVAVMDSGVDIDRGHDLSGENPDAPIKG